jgi:ABC-type spermidine/putrescine transport system permease subunit II
VFSSIRRGITPEINAIATLVLLVTATLLVVAGLAYRRSLQAGRTSPAEDEDPALAGTVSQPGA